MINVCTYLLLQGQMVVIDLLGRILTHSNIIYIRITILQFNVL